MKNRSRMATNYEEGKDIAVSKDVGDVKEGGCGERGGRIKDVGDDEVCVNFTTRNDTSMLYLMQLLSKLGYYEFELYIIYASVFFRQ